MDHGAYWSKCPSILPPEDYGKANGKNHYTGEGPVIWSDYNQSLVNTTRACISDSSDIKVNKKLTTHTHIKYKTIKHVRDKQRRKLR